MSMFKRLAHNRCRSIQVSDLLTLDVIETINHSSGVRGFKVTMEIDGVKYSSGDGWTSISFALENLFSLAELP